MIRRAVLLVLLTTQLAAAQAVTSHLILPSYGGTDYERYSSGPGANILVCWRLPAPLGINNATKLAAGAGNGTGAVTCGFAIYRDGDSGNQLISAVGNCTTGGGGPITGTAPLLIPFSITQGEILRLCTCASTTAGFISYLGIWETATNVENKDALLNALVTTHAAQAANPCVSGTPPTTTGALSTTVSIMPPVMLLE